MGGVAGGRLAAAVTAAGGLGMVGMGSAGSTASLHAELPHVTRTVRNRLGGLGDAQRGGALRRRAGRAAGPVIGQFRHRLVLGRRGARRRNRHRHTGIRQLRGAPGADAGVDMLVARGCRGRWPRGGDDSARCRCSTRCWTRCRCRCWRAAASRRPRSLAAVLAAGASGAWLGTRLVRMSGGADRRRRAAGR